MRQVMLVMAAAFASALPGASANAAPVPAPLSAAAQALTATASVGYRNRSYWSRNYAYVAPWRHVRRPLGAVPPPVGGGGGESFSTGRGTGGGDTASNGTAAFWGTNGHVYSGF